MANDYPLDTIGPIPIVNPNVAKIGEMLKFAKDYANKYYVKDDIPLIGGTQLGDFLLGKAPEEVQRWSEGNYPLRNPAEVVPTGGNYLNVWKTKRFEPTLDVATNVLAPFVGAAKLTKGMPVGLSIAYHNTPAEIEGALNVSKVGSQGGAKYGHGLYTAESPDVAANFGKNQYKVDIPDEHIPKMLDWYAPLAEQPKHVQKVLKKIDPTIPTDANGSEIYKRFAINSDKEASDLLNANGIKGVKYENFHSYKGKGSGTNNYVVFDPIDTKILEKNGVPVNENKPFSVSTRVPTAVKATENPLNESLLSNYKAFRSDQKAFEHNVNLIKNYPNLALKSKNADINAENFVNHVKDNLLYLHDKVPADTRERSKLWYEGANKIANEMAKDYGISEPAASGILSVLSPQKDWFMNVSLGQRVAATMAHKQGFKWDSAMSDVAREIYGKPQYAPLLKAVEGKRLEELNDPVEKAIWIRTHDQAHNPREHFVVTPEGDFSGVRINANGEPTKTGWGSNAEIAKAVDIFDNPTRENISEKLGGQHKVRNFYMNIYDPHNPEGHTTIDTHAVAAGLLRPLSGNTREVSHNFGSNFPGEVGPKNSAFTGKQGTYGLYHEGYQRAAQERGILPREMQSITWEAIRGLFPDTFKSPKNAKEIEDIWKEHKNGKISVDEARQKILEKAGGINEPEWKQ